MTDKVPALIGRLEELLEATASHRERVDTVQAAWDAWYDEGHDIHARYGFGADVQMYRTVDEKDLPEPVEPFAEPQELKQSYVRQLHRLGDQRSVDVLIAALADRSCLPLAAEAVRDIRSDRAVPALLNGVATNWPGQHHTLTTIVATLETYGLTTAQVRERFDTETTPKGRVNLMDLMRRMPDTGDIPAEDRIRDDLIYLALDYRSEDSSEYYAQFALEKMDSTAATVEEPDRNRAPAAHIMREAIILVAQGKPPGHVAQMRRRVLHHAHRTPTATAVESILTKESAEPVLRFALYAYLSVHTREFANPIQVARVLNALLTKRSLSEDAMLALRRGDLLFDLMLEGNEEAKEIFRSFATPKDEDRFARYASARRPRWKLFRWFRRG
jgi:hypothetical protein